MNRLTWILILCCCVRMAVADDHPINNKTNVIIFISFSMPKQSLIAYLSDAKKIHAIVAIRGLVYNSFKETFLAIADLVKESSGGVELNPPLFKKFNIQIVPAVVILPNNSRCLTEQICSDKDYDKISGDIALPYALKEIRDKGEVAQKNAGNLLDSLRRISDA